MPHTSPPPDPAACRRCRYYLITWDARFPYGCRAHTFKSRRNPALDVFESSGLPCLLFAAKSAPSGSGDTLR